MGTSKSEAEHNAIELFRGMVDQAVADETPLEEVLGEVQHTVLDVPFADAPTYFHQIERILKREDTSEPDDDWRSTPMHPAAIALTKEVTA